MPSYPKVINKVSITVLFFVAGAMYFVENYNISIIAYVFMIIHLYILCKQRFPDRSDWRAHPLRLIIPLMLVVQSLIWIIYIFSSNQIVFFDYIWETSYLYDDLYIPQAFASFLALNGIYFISLSIAYKPKQKSYITNNENNSSSILIVLLIILVFISLLEYVFFYTQLLNIFLPPVISHLLKLLARLRPVLTLLVVYTLSSKKSFGAKMGLTFFLILYLTIGFLSLYFTGMRQLIFEPLIILLIIFLSGKEKLQLDSKKFFKLAFGILCIFYMFDVASSIKFHDMPDIIYESFPQKVLNIFQEISFRGTAYMSDLIALSNPIPMQLFDTNKHNIFAEIIYGFPLGSLLVPAEYASQFSFDMQFFWSYFPEGISSTYVSGTTALLYTLGMPLSMLILYVLGAIHGKGFQYVTNWLGSVNSWIIIQSMLALIFLFGLQKMDLLGLPAYTFMAALIYKYFFLKRLL